MKWRITSKPRQNLEEWHLWFAWRPVVIWSTEDDCYYEHWLCYVSRRKNRNYEWEYQLVA